VKGGGGGGIGSTLSADGTGQGVSLVGCVGQFGGLVAGKVIVCGDVQASVHSRVGLQQLTIPSCRDALQQPIVSALTLWQAPHYMNFLF
jgi:hypothetical protein